MDSPALEWWFGWWLLSRVNLSQVIRPKGRHFRVQGDFFRCASGGDFVGKWFWILLDGLLAWLLPYAYSIGWLWRPCSVSRILNRSALLEVDLGSAQKGKWGIRSGQCLCCCFLFVSCWLISTIAAFPLAFRAKVVFVSKPFGCWSFVPPGA